MRVKDIFKNMNKKQQQIFFTVVLFAAIVLLSIVMIFIGNLNKRGRKVRVIQDGTVIYTFDLDNTEDQNIRVECTDGYNVISIKNHEISVSDADCKGRDCVMMGKLKKYLPPIVCIPHKLIIEFEEV